MTVDFIRIIVHATDLPGHPPPGLIPTARSEPTPHWDIIPMIPSGPSHTPALALSLLVFPFYSLPVQQVGDSEGGAL